MSVVTLSGLPRRSVLTTMPRDENAPLDDSSGGSTSLRKIVVPLAPSKLVNQSTFKVSWPINPSHNRPTLTNTPWQAGHDALESNPMDKILAKLCESHDHIPAQHDLPECSVPAHPSSCSLPITPAIENFAVTAPTTRPASAAPNDRGATEELLRLKLELAKAQNHISRVEQELAHSRREQQDSGGATPVLSSDSDFATNASFVEPIGSKPPANLLVLSIPKAQPQRDNWQGPVSNDCRSDTSDAFSASGFNRSRGIWNHGVKSGYREPYIASPSIQTQDPVSTTNWAPLRTQGFIGHNLPSYSVPVDGYRGDRYNNETELMRSGSGRRTTRYDARFGAQPYGNNYGGYNMGNMGQSQYDPVGNYSSGGPTSLPGGGPGIFPPYAPQAIGTPLSPHATEFTSTGSSWKPDVSRDSARRPTYRSFTNFSQTTATEGQTYLPTTEPLNYRRLLDRNVNCNWKYIVDKIVCNNDQQASIFLQQKLKVGTPEQKYEIVEAIVAQAYPLMVNRFGNFLVQRCFEHGTPEQVIKIAEAIRGNTLNLSMDPFGCHVVQKAFDSVPEDYKAIMVTELLRRIPETVIHRYACHVWQKLFELRWTESPPQIMKYVNDALRGMWHEVALGETGSLVVQNIFENCLEEDKVSDAPFVI